jgi:DNA-binding transcriptional LysR family regulator
MRVTLRQLMIFQAVALQGSTSAAARSVPLSQSATSAAVNELEHALGTLLFDRVGKRLLLNDRGRTLLPAARAVLDGAQDIESTFASGNSAALLDLKIFASTTIGNYVLPRVLARYRTLHPDAVLDMRIGNTLDVVTAVREFATDLGFIEGPCHAPDVSVLPWLEDELVVVAASNHPLALKAGRGRLTARQLTQALWLLREPGSGTREAVEQALMPHLPNIRSMITLGSSEAIKNAAAEGLGISCLSRAVVHDLVAADRLVILATRLPRLMRRFSVIHHRVKVLSKPLQGFVAYCENAGAWEAPLPRRRAADRRAADRPAAARRATGRRGAA